MYLSGRVLFSLLALLNFNDKVIASENFALHNGNDRLVADSAERAAIWLLNRRNSESHWGRLVNVEILLALSRCKVFNSTRPEFQLVIQQVDIDFLFDRLKHGDLELYSDRLTPLAVMLTSLCRSPAHYYDYDLLDLNVVRCPDGLLDSRRKTSHFTFAAEMLAVCAGDGVIRRPHVRRLVWLLNPKMWAGPSISFDTLSMLLMATGCVAQHYNQPYLLPFADDIAAILMLNQERDGSFDDGNVVSTALAVQAMHIRGLSVDVRPAVRASVHWLVSNQMEDGSFDSDLMATSEALMALSPMGGRSDIHVSHCDRHPGPTANPTPTHPILNDSTDHLPLQILIWIGDRAPVRRQTLDLQVPVHSTVYQGLQLAQSQGLLRFETREYSFGHYVTSINGTMEVHDSVRQSWMIFVLPSADGLGGDVDAKHLLRQSISSYEIKSGDRILFWYRQPM